MSWTDWINPFNKVVGVVGEYVEDKDALNKINAEIENLRQSVYLRELETKTIPWVDAFHKMGRQLMSYATLGAGVYLLSVNPDINPVTMAAVVGPVGVYNAVKGKGRGN